MQLPKIDIKILDHALFETLSILWSLKAGINKNETQPFKTIRIVALKNPTTTCEIFKVVNKFPSDYESWIK